MPNINVCNISLVEKAYDVLVEYKRPTKDCYLGVFYLEMIITTIDLNVDKKNLDKSGVFINE